jgi:hypothetical protein
MLRHAFEVYQTIPVEETNRIIESQQWPKVIAMIESRIKALIQDGEAASDLLTSTLSEQEG